MQAMPALDYAPPAPWNRRRAGVRTLAGASLLIVAISSVAAIPIYWRVHERRLQERMTEVRRQEIQYRFNERLIAAKQHTEAGRFVDARVAILDAAVARDVDYQLLGPMLLSEMDARVEQARSSVERSEREYRSTLPMCGVRTRKPEDADRLAVLARLVERAQFLTRDRKYRNAIGVCEQILDLDPNNDYARGVLPLLRVQAEKLDSGDPTFGGEL
jgi:hypothetical protein